MHRPQDRRIWQGLATILSLFLVVIAIFKSVDGVLSPERRFAPAQRDTPAGAPPLRGERTLLLLIDSLPYERTLDEQQMKNLARFKTEAVWAKSSGSRDQVTIPAVRAAFTGSERFRIFGFVENFSTGARPLDSLFRQWAESGKKVLVYSDDAFDQFGSAGITKRSLGEPSPNENLAEHQYNGFHSALREWGGGSWDVVIFHATFADEISHRTPHASARYRWAFAFADAWVGEAMQAAGSETNLVVMGDHGHNRGGVHALGMDIHTFVGIRGPRFAKNLELPEQPITLVRYLMGWATGAPLSPMYEGRRFPEALRVTPSSEPYGAYAEQPALRDEPKPSGSAVLSVTAVAGALFGLWILGVRRSWRWGDVVALGVPCCFLLGAAGLPQIGAGVALLALILRLAFTKQGHRLDTLVTLAGTAIVAAMVGYGYYLATHVLNESVSWTRRFNLYVSCALGIGCLISSLLGPKWGTWLTFTCAMLLLPTGNYPWSAVSMWAPALLLVTLVHGASGWLPRFKDPRAPWPLSETLARALAMLGIAWIAQRFWMSVSWDFLFRRFEPLVSGLAAYSALGWRLASLFAKLVFLLRWRRDWRLHAASVAGVALLTAYEWGLWPRASAWNIPAIAALFVSAVLVPKFVRDADSRRELGDIMLLVALLAAFFFSVRNPQGTHFWLSLTAAALALCARLLRPMREDVRRAGHVLLLCIGVVVAGWIDACWSMTHVEWDVLTAHFSAEQIRQNILLFLPVIVLRYAIPVLVFRLVLQGQLGPRDQVQRDWLWTALGLKLGAVVASTFGIGLAVGTAGFFLEGVQHAAVLLVLALGLIDLTARPNVLDPRESSFLWGLVAAVVPKKKESVAVSTW